MMHIGLRKSSIAALGAIVGWILASGQVLAADLYVAPGGSHTTPYETWAKAANDIQTAVDAASAGDVIYVTNTVFNLAAQVGIAKSVTVIGSNNPAGAMAAVDGGGACRGFALSNAGAVVAGFVITNCYAAGDGGGVLINGGTLRDCLVISNRTDRAGGGVYVTNGVLERCEMVDNSAAGNGGGAYLVGPTTRADGCLFSTNISYLYGGGIFITGGVLVANGTASWNRVRNNWGYGGGIYMVGGTVSNMLVFANEDLTGANSYAGGGGVRIAGGLLTHCRIVSNTVKAYTALTSQGEGGGISISAGIVEHCVISSNIIIKNTGNVAGNGGGVRMTGGELRDCDIAHNQAATSFRGGGVYMTGGLLLRCNVYANYSRYGGGGGVSVNGGAVSNCSIYGNVSDGSFGNTTYYRGGGGVQIISGVVANCFIWSNNCARSGGAEIDGAYAVLRNCLVAGNRAGLGNMTYSGGGIRLANGQVENCTVVRNISPDAGGGIYVTGTLATATVTNSIFYHNTAGDILNGDDARFGYCCATSLTAGVNGNITNAPLFVDAGSGSGLTALLGDYHLLQGSPGVNAGIYQAWMDGAADMDGHRRVDWMGRRVDLGCYEILLQGTLMRVR